MDQGLLATILGLTLQERAELVDRLMMSLDSASPAPDLMAKWDQEINRRVDDIERGNIVAYDADEVIEELRNLPDEEA